MPESNDKYIFTSWVLYQRAEQLYGQPVAWTSGAGQAITRELTQKGFAVCWQMGIISNLFKTSGKLWKFYHLWNQPRLVHETAKWFAAVVRFLWFVNQIQNWKHVKDKPLIDWIL
jgi:hypothetical protein